MTQIRSWRARVRANGRRNSFAARAELPLAQGADCPTVARWFEQAIAVAAAQKASSLELRATLRLARLLQAQGRSGEAAARLAAVYERFTEGFDTPDLVAAAELLQALRAEP